MLSLSGYREKFDQALRISLDFDEPKNLYEPVDYILSLGGKKIRPLLTLMAADIFSGSYAEALPAAMAVEIFHNFSLVHDDIMDNAPTRRGKQTVHEKFGQNAGILSGDAMLILAYRQFENYDPGKFSELVSIFSKTALEVCEGQQYDVDFEMRTDVTISDYLKMIELKTAVLIAAALEMGAIVADASQNDRRLIYDFGLNLGIAFQIQDDYLDAFGDAATFGKTIGGDITSNKKTFLYLKAVELSDSSQKETLLRLYADRSDNKIDEVKTVFTASGASAASLVAIRDYTEKAMDCLKRLGISSDKREMLELFAHNLMKRKV